MKILKKVISCIIIITVVLTVFTGCDKVKSIVTDVGDSAGGMINMVGDKLNLVWHKINVKFFKGEEDDVAPIDVGMLTTSSDEPTKKEDVVPKDALVVAVNATFAPYESYYGEEIFGIDIDIAKLVADRLGRELIIRDVSYDRLFKTLEEGKADLIISAITEDDYKGKKLFFSDPYEKDTQAIVVKKKSLDGSEEKEQTMEMLEKGKVGVFIDSSSVFYSEDYFDSASVLEYASYSELFNALVNGAVSAAVTRYDVAQKYVGMIPEIEFHTKNLENPRYVVAARDSAMRDEVNNILKKLASEGEIEKIIRKYVFLEIDDPEEITGLAAGTQSALPVQTTAGKLTDETTLPEENSGKTAEKTEAEEKTTAEEEIVTGEEAETKKNAAEKTTGEKEGTSAKEKTSSEAKKSSGEKNVG